MLKRILIIAFLSLILMQCARRGSPSGGPIDETPPKVVRLEPNQKTLNFNSDRIRIYFDEYIKLNELRDQLVVSPPLEQSKYLISPQGLPAKYLQIEFTDSLPSNTTYTFNFGQSIVDNNEGNVLPFYKYIFSTGNSLDSLSISGQINDAIKRNPDSFVSVMLYPYDSVFTDSIIFKDKPIYYTNTLDSLKEFTIENLKSGKYLLVAQKDQAKNYIFNPSVDKIDVFNNIISIPTDKKFDLTLFKETLDFEIKKVFQAGENRVGFGYVGNASEIKIENEMKINNNFSSIVSFDKETDTIYYWYKNLELDSLNFKIKNDTITNTYVHKIKSADKDSLIVSFNPRNTLHLSDTVSVFTSTPIKKLNKKNMKLVYKDSINQEFEILQVNPHKMVFNFKKTPNQKYDFQILPGSIFDFFDKTNDTITKTLRTKKRTDYGNISIRLINVPSFPIFVDLMNEKEEIKRSKYLSTRAGSVRFNNVIPGKYYLRARVDSNKNGIWDTGSYLRKTKPEPVIHFPNLLDIRANWELQEKFIFK